jgi:hypothetical protein
LTLGGLSRLAGDGIRVEGSLAGEAQLEARLPAMPWRLDLSTVLVGAGPTRGRLVVDAPGGELAAQVENVEAEAGLYRWSLAPQLLDAAMIRALAAKFLTELEGAEWDGQIRLEGEGTWADGYAQGEVRLSWQPGRLAWSAEAVEVLGAVLSSTITLVDSEVRNVAVKLIWESIKVGSIQTGAGDLELTYGGGDPWKVERMATAFWGGGVALSPFSFDVDRFALSTVLTVTSVSAAELVKLIPESLQSAVGTFSGEVGLTWNAVDGFRPDRGRLAIIDQPNARVQMAAAPGLLSARVPQKIEMMPQWLGPLARWAAVENPAFQELVGIETGQRALVVESLQIELYPDGKGGLRTVRADLIARPVGGTAVERVVFGVNVMGPWQDLIMLGANQGANISVRTGTPR